MNQGLPIGSALFLLIGKKIVSLQCQPSGLLMGKRVGDRTRCGGFAPVVADLQSATTDYKDLQSATTDSATTDYKDLQFALN